MDLKVKSKVFYPSHGAGWVKREKEIEFNGDKKKYFEFELINNPITISTPIDNVENLGIRPVLSGRSIRDLIRTLKSKPTLDPKTKDFNSLMSVIQEHEEKASVEGNIAIVQICNHVIKVREKEGRLIPVTIEKQLDQAINDITGELAVSEDTPLEKAKATFTRITGMEAPED
jgi:CarD family transcriptional regulator